MSEHLPLRDEAVREAFRASLEQSFAVEAGAGTGKTTLLVDRLTALITRFSARNIAAITFTEKAARELADRTRSQLERLVLSSEATPKKLLEALQDIDAATLSTIHSFAASMIREKALDAGIDPEFQHFDAYDESLTLQDILAEALSRADDPTQQVLERFLTLGGSIKDLITLVEILYERRDLSLDVSRPAQDKPLNVRFRELVAETQELALLARKNAQPGDECRDALERAGDAAPEGCNLIAPDFWDWIETASAIKHNKGKQDNWSSKELLRQLKKERLPAFREALNKWLVDLRREALLDLSPWLSGVLSQMEKYKSDNGRIGFEDLLLLARRMLDDPALKRHFRDRFERLLIDEFQDTDPLQVEIALRLGGSQTEFIGDIFDEPLEPGRLCIVGDPKQSIYRFRRADPATYLRAAEQVAKRGQRALIVQNFRSAPGIINFVNAFFQSAWPSLADQSIRYEPIFPDPSRAESEPAPPVAVIANPIQGKQSADELRAAEAEALAAALELSVVSECWQVYDAKRKAYRKSEFRDCALLFPTTTGIEHYTERLQRRGIPFKVEGGKRFFVSSLLDDLCAAISAIDNPADRLNVIAALRSRFFGVTDEALARWMELDPRLDYRRMPEGCDEHLTQAAGLLERLNLIRRDVPAERLLEWLLEWTGGWELAQSGSKTEADSRSLERMLNLARKWSQEHGCGLRGFRRWFDRARQKADDSGEAPAGAPKGVSLITIHAAKGLEYPIVMLANLGGRHRNDAPSSLTDRTRRLIQARVGADDRGVFQTAGFEQLLTQEKDAAEAERLRLLYVAMTRARDHLVIPMYYAANKDGEPVESYPRLLRQFFRDQEISGNSGLFRWLTLNAESAVSTAPVAADFDLEPLFAEVEDWRQDRDRRLREAFERLPVKIQPSRHAAVLPEDKLNDAAGTPASSTDAKAVGTAFHRYMERCALQQERDEGLLALVCLSEGVSVEAARALVVTTLSSGMWREIMAARRVIREAPVWSMTGREITRGATDVVWEDASGALHLADFKTGGRQPERHAEQLQIYARILQQATGRTVASARLFYAGEGEEVCLEILEG